MIRRDRRGSEGFDRSEIVQIPSFADGEGAIRVFLGLVHAYATRFPKGDDDESWLGRLGCSGIGGRR